MDNFVDRLPAIHPDALYINAFPRLPVNQAIKIIYINQQLTSAIGLIAQVRPAEPVCRNEAQILCISQSQLAFFMLVAAKRRPFDVSLQTLGKPFQAVTLRMARE